jgi:hypothetical protein
VPNPEFSLTVVLVRCGNEPSFRIDVEDSLRNQHAVTADSLTPRQRLRRCFDDVQLANLQPRKADLRAWADHICNVTMAGESHKERRHLFKNHLETAWTFANWLTHAKGSKWHDAEAAVSTTENAISLCTSSAFDTCAACPRSARLAARIDYRPSAALIWTIPISNGNGPLVTNAIGPNEAQSELHRMRCPWRWELRPPLNPKNLVSSCKVRDAVRSCLLHTTCNCRLVRHNPGSTN